MCTCLYMHILAFLEHWLYARIIFDPLGIPFHIFLSILMTALWQKYYSLQLTKEYLGSERSIVPKATTQIQIGYRPTSPQIHHSSSEIQGFHTTSLLYLFPLSHPSPLILPPSTHTPSVLQSQWNSFSSTHVDTYYPVGFLFLFLIFGHITQHVPQPGIKSKFLALEAWSLNHWTTEEVLPSIVSISCFLQVEFSSPSSLPPVLLLILHILA